MFFPNLSPYQDKILVISLNKNTSDVIFKPLLLNPVYIFSFSFNTFNKCDSLPIQESFNIE